METFNLIAENFYNVSLIILTITSIWLFTPHFKRLDKRLRNTKIVIVVYHIQVLADILIGNMMAVVWIFVIMLWYKMYHAYMKEDELLKKLKDERQDMLIKAITDEFNLDQHDISIVENAPGNIDVYYKGKIFNPDEYDKNKNKGIE
jgi:hypothetical protein